MSWASARAEDQHFAERDAAIGIAVSVGLLRRCEWHPDIVMEGDRTRLEDAYRIGNARITRGGLRDIFASRRAMTDAIKAVENEHGLNSCPRCDNLLKD
jgi:hypothetical protein